MKKLSALLLALVLAAAMCLGAMAETTVDYTGAWALSLMKSGEVALEPSALGVDMTIVLNADGTCTLSSMGMTEEGTWVATEAGVALTDAAGTTDTLTYVEGTLVMASEGVEMIFTPAVVTAVDETEYAQILANLTLADFNGNWELEHVETTFSVYEVADLGATMSVMFKDGTGHVEMVTEESTTSMDAICEAEEVEDLGTVLWASFLDEAGEPDGTGMMFLLYDDGQLVWYEYDSAEQCEYFYCFDKVTEPVAE